MNKFILFVATFSLTLSLTLWGGTYRKEFRAVPKSMANCHEQATELTEKFEEQTGNKTGSVACLKTEGKFANFELSYEADKPLFLASTDIITYYNMGIFKKEEDCKTKLADAEAKFERNTGLKIYISYCRPEAVSYNPRWSPHILGFGEAKKSYWVSGYIYTSVPDKFDADTFVANLKKSIAKRGGELAHVASIPSLGYGTMTIHHYAEDSIHFSIGEYSKSAALADCQTNRERLKDALQKHSLESISSYCGALSVGGYWELTAIYPEGDPFTERFSAENFSKLSECEANRPRLTQYYMTNVDKKIVEGFCTREGSEYRVLFLRLRK